MIPDKKAAAKNFSRAARSYNAHASAQSFSADKLCRLIKNHVDIPVDRVADLGCGTGMLSRRLVETFPDAKLAVVDISPDMLSQCYENLNETTRRLTAVAPSQVRYLQADIETEAWGTDFSLIASNYCLQWTDPKTSLANIAPRLRPDGYFAFSVPCRGTFPELHAALREVRKLKPGGLKYYSAEAWTRMLRQVGLEVIKHDVFTTVLSFDSSALALRSFSKIGATFSRHTDYKPLGRDQIAELLQIYDKKSGATEAFPHSRVTYKTLTVIARLQLTGKRIHDRQGVSGQFAS